MLVPSLGLCLGFRIRGSVFGCFRVDEKVEGLIRAHGKGEVSMHLVVGFLRI